MFKLGDFVRFVDEKREGYVTRIIDAQTFGVTDTDVFEITTDPNDFGAVCDALEAKGYTFESAEVAYIPQTMTALTDEEDIKWMERLIDMLEENDDVQEIWHNWEMPEE